MGASRNPTSYMTFGAPLQAGLSVTAPENDRARITFLGDDGVLREGFVDLVPVGAPPPPPAAIYEKTTAPTLADLAPYAVADGPTGAKRWRAVPYKPGTFFDPPSGTTMAWVIDIDVPPGAPPPGGWKMCTSAHANGQTYSIPEGGQMDTYYRAPALAAGFAHGAIEFRSPGVGTVTPDDIGRAWQFIRSLSTALELDVNHLYAFGRSRGSLSMWQALQADMQDLGATAHMHRQSSRPQGVAVLSPQCTYRNQRFGEIFVLAGAERDEFYTHYPPSEDGSRGSAIDDVATVPLAQLMPLSIVAEDPWFGGQVTYAQAESTGQHMPDVGRVMRDAYAARGVLGRIVVIDNEPDTAPGNATRQIAYAISWFKGLADGLSAVEARAVALARERNAALLYVPGDRSGTTVNADGTGGIVAVGGTVGTLVDGQYGRANRVAAAPLGYAGASPGASKRPTLTSYASGYCGLAFDADDLLQHPMPSDGTHTFRAWTDQAAPINTLKSTDATKFIWGDPAMAGRTSALAVCADAAPSVNDYKLWQQLATVISGVSYT